VFLCEEVLWSTLWTVWTFLFFGLLGRLCRLDLYILVYEVDCGGL